MCSHVFKAYILNIFHDVMSSPAENIEHRLLTKSGSRPSK
jgi:hypothetical protein